MNTAPRLHSLQHNNSHTTLMKHASAKNMSSSHWFCWDVHRFVRLSFYQPKENALVASLHEFAP